MIESLLIKTPAGLYCEVGDFYLDPRKAVNNALVSHAHGDHAVPTTGKIYCTTPTISFMKHRFSGRKSMNFIPVKFGESFFMGPVKITYFPAGHILGSAQIRMEYNGKKYLYTGDFKVQSDDSCEKFEFVECDYLITETTFASPEYNHPDPGTEINKLLNEYGKVIIGAYALGKSQRLTQLITRHNPDVTIFIHEEPGAYHRLYEEHGYSLGKWRPYRRSEFDNCEKAVIIVPPSHFRKKGNGELLRVFATGWKRSFYRCDKVLPISDHADWQGVLQLIEKTKAKKVFTVHGNGKFLQEHMKERIEVKIIS